MLNTNKYLFFAVLAMILLVGASNYLVEVPINEWLTYGAFTYPATFLVNELVNRFHGPQAARRVVYAGFVVAIIVTFFWMNPRIAFASSMAFLIGQLLDISVFSRLRQLKWWVAPLSASLCASLIDTIVFFSIAFIGTGVPWITLGIGDCGVKLSVDLLMLLPFRLFLRHTWK